MGNQLKSMVLVGVCTILPFCVSSCSSDELGNQKETIENSSLSITNSNIEKNWILSHFQFTEGCDSNVKLKYQLSMIHLELKNGIYKSVDNYALTQDQGTWTLEDNILKMTSTQDSKVTKYKIAKLSNREMLVEAIDDPNLLGIELIAK